MPYRGSHVYDDLRPELKDFQAYMQVEGGRLQGFGLGSLQDVADVG